MSQSTETMNQILSLMTVASNEFGIGIANGWLSPTLNSLQNTKGEFHITMEESSWIASLDHCGKIFGAIFTAFTLDIVGRKILLTSSALVIFLMWAVLALTKSVSVLCVIRFIFGLFVGINDGTSSTYLAENSSPMIRSIFGAVSMTLYYIGLLFEYIVATYFSYTKTSIINTSVTFLSFLSVLWIKEPVQYLLMKKKHTQARRNFIWLYGTDVDNEDIIDEFEKMKQNAQAESVKKSSFKKTIISPANYKSLFIMVTLYALIGCTGYFPILAYASMTFSASDIFTPNEFTIFFGIAQTIVVASTSIFIGRFNRRTIILICLWLIALSHAVTTGLYYLNSQKINVPYFPRLVFASITFYASVFAFVNPFIFIIRGELFPLSVKATGGCLSIIAYNATNFLTTKVFLFIANSWGIEANFLLFCLLTTVSIVFVYLFLPETRNKSLIEIQEMLERTRSIIRVY